MIPGAVLLAAQVDRSETHGVIINERHIRVAISAGPVHYRERNDAFVMQQGGAFTRLQYVQITKNGHVLSAKQVADRQEQDNRALAIGAGFFKQPFDPLYLRDYSYRVAACRCAMNERAIAFRSDVRDDQHGDGLMHIDRTTGRVLDLTYTPNVLPKYASVATTTESFGEPLPGLWCIVHIERSYSGHLAFFRGQGVITESLDNFSRPLNARAGFALLSAAH